MTILLWILSTAIQLALILKSKVRLVRLLALIGMVANLVTLLSRFLFSSRTDGIVWCISQYILLISMAYVAAEFTDHLVPDKAKKNLKVLPPALCLTFCITSWPPTRQVFYWTVFRCIMVCMGTLMSGILWRMKNSITPLVVSFSVLLGLIGMSALRNGQLWDGAWFIGFSLMALALKRIPATSDYGGY